MPIGHETADRSELFGALRFLQKRITTAQELTGKDWKAFRGNRIAFFLWSEDDTDWNKRPVGKIKTLRNETIGIGLVVVALTKVTWIKPSVDEHENRGPGVRTYFGI